MWGGGGGGGRPVDVDEKGNIEEIFPSRRCGPTQVQCDGYTNQSVDGEFTGRNNPNRPIYKPEYWDKVQQLDMNTNTEDPLFICQPLGLPRVGPARPHPPNRQRRRLSVCGRRREHAARRLPRDSHRRP